MRNVIENLSKRLELSGESMERIKKEFGIKHISVAFDDGAPCVCISNGIEKLINSAGIKCVYIEEGIVRCEAEGIEFYEYVLPERRKVVFSALKLEV